jgi:hypothetical protein
MVSRIPPIRTILFVGLLMFVRASSAADMRGAEAEAIAVAVSAFKKIYAKPDLKHYSVQYVRRGSNLQITFTPDSGRQNIIGGATEYGPAMTYVISLRTFKIVRYNFWR